MNLKVTAEKVKFLKIKSIHNIKKKNFIISPLTRHVLLLQSRIFLQPLQSSDCSRRSHPMPHMRADEFSFISIIHLSLGWKSFIGVSEGIQKVKVR